MNIDNLQEQTRFEQNKIWPRLPLWFPSWAFTDHQRLQKTVRKPCQRTSYRPYNLCRHTVVGSLKSWPWLHHLFSTYAEMKKDDSCVSVILFSIVNLLYNHIRRQRYHRFGRCGLSSPRRPISKIKLAESGSRLYLITGRDEIKNNKMVNVWLCSVRIILLCLHYCYLRLLLTTIKCRTAG